MTAHMNEKPKSTSKPVGLVVPTPHRNALGPITAGPAPARRDVPQEASDCWLDLDRLLNRPDKARHRAERQGIRSYFGPLTLTQASWLWTWAYVLFMIAAMLKNVPDFSLLTS